MTTSWGQITAKEILSPLEGSLVSGRSNTVLTGLSTDSRKIEPGEVFLALKGERYDGHQFVGKALAKGASGVIVQRGRTQNSQYSPALVITVNDTLKALGDLAKWWRQQHHARVVAITGSVGKTTAKEMTAAILGLRHRVLKNQGSFNNLIGLPLTLLRLEEGQDRVIVEMGMNRPGEIARLTEISDPHVGVITNVAMAHLEGVGDLQGVANAKVELVKKISPDGVIILNGEDELLMQTASPFKRKMITFGLGEKNTVRALHVRNHGAMGVSFYLRYQATSWPVKLRVPGLQNVFNALAAATIGLYLHESPERVVEGLESFSGLKGRFMVQSLPGGAILVDDTYNANPYSLEAALESLAVLKPSGRRLIIALGEMMELGDATLGAHREAGRRAAAMKPHLFLAMGEHAPEMIAEAVKEGVPTVSAEVVKSHEEMVERIRQEIREGDLVFLKGSRRMALDRVAERLKKKNTENPHRRVGWLTNAI